MQTLTSSLLPWILPQQSKSKLQLANTLPSRKLPVIMSSNAPMTVKDVTERHGAGESPLPKVDPEFELAMIEGLETGTFKNPQTGKTLNMNEAREAGIAASEVTFVPLSQLKDTQNRPVVMGKRYLFRVAGSERDRMTDFEDNNLKRVVNNAKWHNGIYLKIFKFASFDQVAKIEYPSRGKWLEGVRYAGNDVVLGDSPGRSMWLFEDQERESHGFPSYAMYSELWE